MKILYTTKEAFERVKMFLDAGKYDWSYETQGDDNYLVTIIY